MDKIIIFIERFKTRIAILTFGIVIAIGIKLFFLLLEICKELPNSIVNHILGFGMTIMLALVFISPLVLVDIMFSEDKE